jgi:hypothetical protein
VVLLLLQMPTAWLQHEQRQHAERTFQKQMLLWDFDRSNAVGCPHA